MAYLLGYKGSTVSPSVAAPYLTWAANPSESNLAQVKAAKLKAYVYTDGVVQYPCPGCSHLWTPLQAQSQYVARDCAGEVLQNGAGEIVDVTKSGWHALWVGEVENEYAKVAPSSWDAVFADDSAAPHFEGFVPCGTTASTFTAAIYKMLAATRRPVIFNGLSVSAKQPEERTLYAVPNVIGGMRETCYSGSSAFGFARDFVVTTEQHFYGAPNDEWTQTEDDQLYAARLGKLFVCLSNAADQGASATGARTYVYASFLLTYDPRTSILFEEFAPTRPGGLTVYPETGLVPTHPDRSQPMEVASLARGGVYVREYDSCFYRGSYVGRCAAVVNPGSASQTYPLGSKYQHTLVLSGGGVLEGGVASTSGPAPKSFVEGSSAVIAIQ
jgi:hypothetical protein